MLMTRVSLRTACIECIYSRRACPRSCAEQNKENNSKQKFMLIYTMDKHRPLIHKRLQYASRVLLYLKPVRKTIIIESLISNAILS